MERGKLERLPGLAAQLVRLTVNVIVTVGTPATRGAKQATTTIPIVMVSAGDPVGAGLVASVAQPGHQAFLREFIFEIRGGKHRIIEVVPKEKTIFPPACRFA